MNDFIFINNSRVKNYSGLKKNKLTAIKFSRILNNATYWIFKCDCGKEKELKSNKVFQNNATTKSCGCLSNKNININPAISLKIRSYKSGAKKRNLIYDLTFDCFLKLTSGNCFYCGIKPNKISKAGFHEYIYNGIDRVNNSIGYTIENTVSCCSLCNKAKRDLDYDIFKTWIERVSIYQSEKREIHLLTTANDAGKK